MMEIFLISVSLVAICSVVGLVYLAKTIINNDVKEREMLVKMLKSKDLKEFEYIMVDENANPEKGEIAEVNNDLVDVERMPDLKVGE